MSAHKEHENAYKLIKVLIQRSEQGLGPIEGYDVAGKLVDSRANSQHFGQVCSLIDLACLYAGYPLLALSGVRTKRGDIHSHIVATNSRESIDVSIAMQSKWNSKHEERLLFGLSQIKAGAKSGWKEVGDRVSERGAAYIEYNLHRKLDHFLELAQS
jgi:hypothetical protein